MEVCLYLWQLKKNKLATPYKESDKDKKSQVAGMFNSIAGKYDFLNHFLSAGIDVLWRKKTIKTLKKHPHATILDVATGTADLAIEASKINPEKITGIDISSEMLEVGRKKIAARGLQQIIELKEGDCENLAFSDNSFDAVTVAFGVRNFEDPLRGLTQMQRVLKPGGVALILEFSKPTVFPVRQLYFFYFKFILPVIGRIVSKDQAAYTYLPDSVNEFPCGQAFLDLMTKAGFEQTRARKLTFGIATLYKGIRPA